MKPSAASNIKRELNMIFKILLAISFGDLATTMPFENCMDILDLRGDHLVEALEFSVSKSTNSSDFFSNIMLQVSGAYAESSRRKNAMKPLSLMFLNIVILQG